MLTLAQIQQLADDRLTSLWNSIKARQAVYLANRGRYWQGVRTHVIQPSEGTETPATATERPSNEADDWRAAGVNIPANLPCSVRVDVYGGPNGAGFTATAEVEVAGNVWTRTVNQGPETWRVRPWTKLEPGVS